MAPSLCGALLAAAVLVAAPAHAQLPGLQSAAPLPAPTPPAAVTVESPIFDDTTPRGSVYNFIAEVRRVDYAAAARHLDLTGLPEQQRAAEGPVLARHLKAVLDRTAWLDLTKISDSPEGDRDDGLPAGTERIGIIEASDGTVAIILRRVRGADGTQTWKFSPSVVARIPDLYDEFGYGWLGEHVPDRLRHMRWFDLEMWQTLALLVLVVLAWLLSRAATFVLLHALEPVVRRSKLRMDDLMLAKLRPALRWVLALGLFASGVAGLHLSVAAQSWLNRLLGALAFASIVIVVAAAVDSVATAARERLEREGERSGAGIVRFVNGIIKGLLALIALIAFLQALGFNVTSLLAGLGIGGIAVALAAQRTLENLLGGISVMLDKPVKVGDLCSYGGKTGWIEEFGFRSTRIRTLESSLVSIPNGVFSNMEIENLSVRPRLRFFTALRLRPETTPDQLRAVLASTRELLIGHPMVAPDRMWVRLAGVEGAAYMIEIQALVTSSEWEVFLAVREDLLLRMIDIVAANGSGLAFPGQSVYPGTGLDMDTGAARAAEAHVRALRAAGRLPFPDFTPEEKQAMADRIDYPPIGSSTAVPPVGVA